MSWQLYFESAFSYIAYSDIIPATLKTVVFGFLIAVVSSYLGFTTSRGTEGVGEASTRSVVMASMLIILSDVHAREDDLLLLSGGVGMNAVRFDHVSKAFGPLTVLDDISFEIPAGQAFCLLGRSGTRQERHPAAHRRPGAAGQRQGVRRGSRHHRRWPDASSPTCGKHMGFLFQNAALFDSMSVGENVAFPMRRHTDWSDADIRERATQKLADVGLEKDYDKMPARPVGWNEEAGRARPRHGARPLDPARGRAERRSRSDHGRRDRRTARQDEGGAAPRSSSSRTTFRARGSSVTRSPCCRMDECS